MYDLEFDPGLGGGKKKRVRTFWGQLMKEIVVLY